MVESSIKRFDDAAEKLLEKYEADGDIAQKLRAYIGVCRHNCTGNLCWSLCTGRYGVHCADGDGHIDVQL